MGEGASTPSSFGQLSIDADVGNENVEDTVFAHIRLLPSRARFKKQIERWAATALEELAEEEAY